METEWNEMKLSLSQKDFNYPLDTHKVNQPCSQLCNTRRPDQIIGLAQLSSVALHTLVGEPLWRVRQLGRWSHLCCVVMKFAWQLRSMTQMCADFHAVTLCLWGRDDDDSNNVKVALGKIAKDTLPPLSSTLWPASTNELTCQWFSSSTD